MAVSSHRRTLAQSESVAVRQWTTLYDCKWLLLHYGKSARQMVNKCVVIICLGKNLQTLLRYFVLSVIMSCKMHILFKDNKVK